MVAAEDNSQDHHQDRSVKAPVAERRIGAHKLARRCFCIEYAVHAILVVRIVFATIQDTFPVIKCNRVGD